MKTNILYIYLVLTTAMVFNSCVQETHPKTIHFKLDMRNETQIENVGVRGKTAPLSWDKTFLLTDDDHDSIYEGDIQLNSANFDIEFKFVNQDEEFELKHQPNRSIRFEYKPETIIYEAIFNDPEGVQTQKSN